MSNSSPAPAWRRNSNTFPSTPSSTYSSSSTSSNPQPVSPTSSHSSLGGLLDDHDLHVPLLRNSQGTPLQKRRKMSTSSNDSNHHHHHHTLRNSLTINRPLPDPEKPANTQRSKQDFIIILLVLLLSESARGIVLPTFAPFVELIGGNAVWLGFAVGAFSAGRFGSTIGLGYLSDRISYKTVLAWSVVICIIGNIFYGISDIAGLTCMIVARAITGVGAGTLSVIRAYTAHITLPSERTKFMSILGAVQFFGFAIMPGVGSALSYIPEFDILIFRFNKYTIPGYFLAGINLFVLIVLVAFFQNPAPVSSTPSTPPATNRISTPPPTRVSSSTPPPTRVSSATPPPHRVSSPTTTSPISLKKSTSSLNRSSTTVQINRSNNGVTPAATGSTTHIHNKKKYMIFAIFLALNLMVRLVLGVIETLGTPMYIDVWENPTGKDVEAGFVFGGLGLIGMGVLFGISYLSKKLSDLIVMIAGLVCLTIGSAFLIGDTVGLPRFIIGTGLIWCIGYPLSQTIIVSMFSKALGSAPQGGWMGWIGAMGSAGRVVGPIISGALYHKYGQTMTMLFCVVVSFLSLLVSFLLIERKKPVLNTSSALSGGNARF